jgi:hypothetical protein
MISEQLSTYFFLQVFQKMLKMLFPQGIPNFLEKLLHTLIHFMNKIIEKNKQQKTYFFGPEGHNIFLNNL